MKKIEEIKKIENFIEDDRMRKELFEAEVNLNKIIDIETQGAIARARREIYQIFLLPREV